MIQRIQSIYLAIAIISLIVAIVLLGSAAVWGAEDGLMRIFGGAMLACWALSAVMMGCAIFAYLNRRKQMKQVRWANCMIGLSYVFLAAAYYVVDDGMKNISLPSIALAIVAMLLAHLAWRNIKADEEKVRAADRIR
ncbi:MAG: DUF4293 family protein [Bacteroidaceae bacterium]|nr:DUF4293 family protein [Bacteroidaceae bacterium]